MNPLHRHVSRSGCTHRRFTTSFLRFAALAALSLPLGGCSSTRASRVGSAFRIVYHDATSAAGRKFLADLTSSAFNVGLDIAAGKEVDAVIAGIQGAASAVRDYEGLPAAPSSAALAKVAAAGTGNPRVAAALGPNVETLLENARRTAAQQQLGVSTDDIVEALARGFDAVADAQHPSPVNR